MAKANEKINKEGTEVIIGAEEIVLANVKYLSEALYEINTYTDSIGPIIFSKVEEVKKAYADALKSGVKIRLITEITKENLSYTKEGMKYVSELRHLDGIFGTFAISDKHYLSNIIAENIGSFQCIHSNISSFVEQQKNVFENLWSNAIPAIDKIKEIEGDEIEFSKTLTNNIEIQNLFVDLLKSSQEEILALFSFTDDLLKYVNLGILELLVDAIIERKIKVRFLLPADIQNHPGIDIRTSFQTNLNKKKYLKNDKVKDGVAARKGEITIKILDNNYKDNYLKKTPFILIIDSKVSLIRKTTYQENIGGDVFQHLSKLKVENQTEFCTYSNEEGLILSNISIYETLWENAYDI